MFLTPHFLTGAAIAQNSSDPTTGLIFAFLSHYLLDAIPHREYAINNIRQARWDKSLPDFLKSFLDLFLALAIVFLLSKNKFLAIAGGFAAILPDALTVVYLRFKNSDSKIIKALERHHFFHDEIIHWFEKEKYESKNSLVKKISLMGKILSQFIVMAIAVLFLLR